MWRTWYTDPRHAATRARPQLKALPAKPGVYQYYNADGDVIYVGKAVNLRNRVRSYFHKSGAGDPKTLRLVAAIDRLEWIVTGSELEALLLEMNLIKQHRPRYNVVLKDDKRYPYIKVTWSDPFPTVYATRKVAQDGARYFGPYTSAGAMHDTLHTLRKVFPYLDCNRAITGADPRACLYHDIGLCLAPCIGAVDKAGYRAMIERLCRFLEGDTASVVERLRVEMQAHAERLAFEEAARLRDRMASIEQIVERQRIIAPTLADQDVMAVAREDGSAVAQVFFVRNGKLIGRETFQLAGTDGEPDGAVLASFLKQFYDETALVPGEIVLPEQIVESEIIERWLSDKRGTRVRLTVPRRGRKRELVQVAVDNAAETLRALQAAHAVETRADTAAHALAELEAALGLPRSPRRIECYDISNLQGTHIVGSMVVFEDAAPVKADYRHFKMRDVPGQDDFASMAEMLTRRFQRLARFRADGRADDRTTGDAEPSAFEKTPTWCWWTAARASSTWRPRCCKRLGWTTSRWRRSPSGSRRCSDPAGPSPCGCPPTARRCTSCSGRATRPTASRCRTTASCATRPGCAPASTTSPGWAPSAAGRSWCTSARWTASAPPASTTSRPCRA